MFHKEMIMRFVISNERKFLLNIYIYIMKLHKINYTKNEQI